MSKGKNAWREEQVDLTELWCHELLTAWKTINSTYLRDALRSPQIEVTWDSEATLGDWNAHLRRIRIAGRHILRDPWSAVLETLRHEVAHQFTDEVLGAHDEAPHGPAFREACRRVRADPRARAQPCSSRDSKHSDGAEAAEPKIVATIRKLLALGSSSNENEAAAAMRKARSLLHAHKLEVADLDQESGFDRRILGEVKGRHAGWEYARGRILTDFFFVTAIWVPSFDALTLKSGSALEIHGRKGDVDLAAWVHDWLADTVQRIWREYRAQRRLRGDAERRRYFDGLLHGFHKKLEAQQQVDEVEYGLVPLRDAELEAHVRWLYPYTRTTTRTTRCNQVYHDGLRDGASIDLHRPLREKGGGPRALPGSSSEAK